MKHHTIRWRYYGWWRMSWAWGWRNHGALTRILHIGPVAVCFVAGVE